MEIKGEQIQNRYKYSSMMRIINVQKIGMARMDLRQKGWSFLIGCAASVLQSSTRGMCW